MTGSTPDFGTILKTILKLVLISLLVGFGLNLLGVTPEAIFANFGDTMLALFREAERIVAWSAGYIVTGAAIVVPIWLVVKLVDMLSGRRRGR